MRWDAGRGASTDIVQSLVARLGARKLWQSSKSQVARNCLHFVFGDHPSTVYCTVLSCMAVTSSN